ncbi:MAG: RNA methyltransferase [Planctomycetaceae bacterium]|nr:RNA methyltransferase [Planctomycetaceae bacterium]
MGTKITSLQNPRIKEMIRLRDGRHRRKQGRILIDGVREIERAMQAGVLPGEVVYCEQMCDAAPARELLARAEEGQVELIEVSGQVFEKLAFGARAEGVVAVASTPQASLAELVLRENDLVVVLEGVEKPGNVGAVLRSADATGAGAVIVADGRTDLFNPNAIRASLGTIFTVPVAEASSRETLDWLRRQGYSIFAARVDGSAVYTEADFRGAAAIVLGSEADGLTDVWSDEGIEALRLPMLGVADSLNVSVTAAVMLYEAVRQRS